MKEKLVPDGFQYFEEAVDENTERGIIQFAENLSYVPYVMRGVASKRRIYMFGTDYSTAERLNMKAEPLPEILVGLLDRFEIWDPARYEKVKAADAVLAQEAFKLME